MALTSYPFKTPSAPRGPAGSSFRTVGGPTRMQQMAGIAAANRRGGSKKGYAGKRAGLRAPRPTPGRIGPSPRGPGLMRFPSTQLGSRKAFAPGRSSTPVTAPRASLLSRTVAKARRAFTFGR
jgi:hypothetical protein